MITVIFLLTLIILSIFGFYKLCKQKNHQYIEDMASYPTRKVMLCYGLFGGAVGSFFVYLMACCVFFIQAVLELQNSPMTMSNISDASGELIGLLVLVMIFDSILGTFPAFVVGSWLAYKKTVIHSKQDFTPIFMKISGLVCLVGVPISLFSGDIDGGIGSTFGWALLCSISSVVVGFFVLPRSKNKPQNNLKMESL